MMSLLLRLDCTHLQPSDFIPLNTVAPSLRFRTPIPLTDQCAFRMFQHSGSV